MKTLILLLISTMFVFSQETNVGQVEYTAVLNLNQPEIYKTVLLFNNSKSYYFLNETAKKFESNVKEGTNDENEVNISVSLSKEIYTDSIGSINYKDFERKRLVTRTFLDKKLYYVKEDIPLIEWSIVDETKNIGSFNCQKATATFRGRNYTAWFTNEVPISNGPWKLHGLPGLILEASDDTKEVTFYFKSFKISSTIEMPAIEIPIQDAISLIEFEKIIKMSFDNYLTDEKVKKKFQSKLPRNVTVKVQSNRKVKRMEIIDIEN